MQDRQRKKRIIFSAIVNANKIITYQNGILFIPPQFVQWKPGQATSFIEIPPLCYF